MGHNLVCYNGSFQSLILLNCHLTEIRKLSEFEIADLWMRYASHLTYYAGPSRDFSPFLKQYLSGLSGFSDDCSQNLASKWAVFERFIKKTAQKPLKFRTVLSVLSKTTARKPRKIRAVFWAVYLEKPLKAVQILGSFWAVFLDKPFKNHSNLSIWSEILRAIV